MKIPLSWIQEYIDTGLPASELAERLTMAGTEIKGVQVIGARWDNVVIGCISAIDPHRT